jgi:hypothetical protein
MNLNPFKLDLPRSWDDQTVYYFRGPDIDEKEHQIILTIDRYLQHEDIEDFAREQTDPLLQNLQGLEVLKDEDVAIDDGNPVWEFVCRWTPGENVSVFKKYIFVFFDGMGFTFQAEFSKKSYKILGSQMKQMVENLLPGTYEPLEE